LENHVQSDINFQCKWKDHEKQERYNRYCINVKDGKLNPYDGLAPGNLHFIMENRSSYAESISDDYTKWEIDKEKAEFERAATQKSAITEIMKNRFKRAQFQDKEENVSLARSKREKMYQVI
jgi:nitrate reductase beta subunit